MTAFLHWIIPQFYRFLRPASQPYKPAVTGRPLNQPPDTPHSTSVVEQNKLKMNASAQFRAKAAFETRVNAAELARSRPLVPSVANGEETFFRDPDSKTPSFIASFTKGLNHTETGQIARPADFQAFVRAADSGDINTIAALPLGPPRDENGLPIWKSDLAKKDCAPVRGWESMSAGLAFDLEGPDAQSVAMPPVPRLMSPELSSEMAEVYLMALARDYPISSWSTPEAKEFFEFAIKQLNTFSWFTEPATVSDSVAEIRRRRGPVTIDNIFRGILPGSQTGPFLSQFLIAGSAQLGGSCGPNAADEFNGIISYGSITIDQRVRIATAGKDFMTDFKVFLDVQNAADLRGGETYEKGKRLIATIRDLCTWVHFDALYEAYLNACLILLANRVPFDPSLPFTLPDSEDAQEGFATFGGAHILSLVTEVATRALKAVRFQKFNVHRRARPEAIGGLIHANKTAQLNGKPSVFPEVDGLVEELGPILDRVEKANLANNEAAEHSSSDPSFLLPMAFSEGSPMHPAYGSGHATVAGACVTILKAFFDADHVIDNVFEVDVENDTLRNSDFDGKLTVAGELNKLADNISIGRNMAGVHYFTDAFESLLLGEQIAIGILEEQKLTFRENFAFNLTKFDGTSIRI